MVHRNVKEMEPLLKQTFDPIESYATETTKIAGRVKAATQKKESLAKLKEEINTAALQIFDENSRLEQDLVKMKAETEVLKKTAKERMTSLPKPSA